jgi:hypothetical protein
MVQGWCRGWDLNRQLEGDIANSDYPPQLLSLFLPNHLISV